jgi:3-deoxy-7-phosphoheptulonate synthase
MNYTKIKKLPSVEEIIQLIPLSDAGHEKIMRDRREIKNILEGHDDRLLMIIGPCSAWPKEGVYEYARRLVELNAKVNDTLKIVMRLYIQKPRTTKGWTGPVNQPDPFATPDIEAGIHYSREMMVRVVEMGLPIADESLFTNNARGFSELVSWFAIGARSTEDQEHRVFASATDCPVGMKNPTHGSIEVGINSIIAAQHPHMATIDQYAVQTHGNAHAHLVLRGSNKEPNYSLSHLEEVKHYMELHAVKNPALLIDVSHDNCLVNGKKDYRLQPQIIFDIINNLKARPDLRKYLKGFMVESYLKEGCQKLDENNPSLIDLEGLSITDPCLGWSKTENLLLTLAEELR